MAGLTGGHKKRIYLLRHGQTEMNVFLEQQDSREQRSEAPGFEDPLLFDTKLTAQGEEESREAAAEAKKLDPPPEIVLSSPLSRALRTADLAFADFQGPFLALSLARERTYFASDVGVRRSELAKLWPHWSFDGVTEEIWWLDHTADKSNPNAVIKESEGHFRERMSALKADLSQRHQKCIALVVHRDVIESIAGRSPANCEFCAIDL